jgi:hypothetical protein
MSVDGTEYGYVLRWIIPHIYGGHSHTLCGIIPTCSYDSGLMFISIRIPSGYENNIPLLSESVGNEAQWILSHGYLITYLSFFNYVFYFNMP